eukprot:sb/3476562/
MGGVTAEIPAATKPGNKRKKSGGPEEAEIPAAKKPGNKGKKKVENKESEADLLLRLSPLGTPELGWKSKLYIKNYSRTPIYVTSSGKRVLVTKSGWPLNRGQIPLISYIGGNLSCH